MTAKFLRLFAILIFIATMAFWAISGANSGLTKSAVSSGKTDAESYAAARGSFHPGIEFLAGNALLAALLFGASFFVGRKSR